jgi:methylated-DNA-[protein]-cysteine S-methyltransferase
MASDGECLTGLWFDGQKYFADTLPAQHEEKDLYVFRRTDSWLDMYFSGKKPDFTPPLRMRGTGFRQEVWQILLTIPFGKTITYGEIAKILADRRGNNSMSAQAVGGAVAHNPVSLIIPCHRVIGTNGALTGYAGGLDKKTWLLDMERKNTLDKKR